MDILKWIQEHWNIQPDIQLKIFYSLITMISLVIIRGLLFKAVFWQVKGAKERYHWKNGIKYTFVAISLIIIVTIWINEFSSVATFFGLLSAGLAVALKDPIVNMVGWAFIMVRRPFEVGDRVEIDGHAGDVIDIRAFQFTLNEVGNWVDSDQSTGRIIHIPNGKVFTDPQANYNQGFSHIWNEIGVLITFESDWEVAKSILEKIVNENSEDLTKIAQERLIEASKKFMIFYNTLSPVVYTSVKASGIMLSIRYLCLPKRRRGTEQQIWESVLLAFAKHDDIELAYPTQRIYFEPREGKNQAGKTKNTR